MGHNIQYEIMLIGFLVAFTTIAIASAVIVATMVARSAFDAWWAHKEDKASRKRVARDNLEELIYNLYGVEVRPTFHRHIRNAMRRHRARGSSYWLPPGSSK